MIYKLSISFQEPGGRIPGAGPLGGRGGESSPSRVRGARGPASGRPFDPGQAGGPIRQLSTEGVRVTSKGVDVVERHLARFGADAANPGMIEKLRRIASGELKATTADMNFYTHELREFVRYRRLGHPEGNPGHDVWDNAHTATLEDYGLKGNTTDLYDPDIFAWW